MNEKQIKELRKMLSLSQEEFARIIRVTLATVSRWERGISKPRDLAEDKLLLINSIAERVKAVFGTIAKKWLESPNDNLKGQKPVKVLETFEGIEKVNTILNKESKTQEKKEK